MSESASPTDLDLDSIRDARTAARHASRAQARLADLTQEQVDRIVETTAAAATSQAVPLARMAVEETGYGIEADKVRKNLFASETVSRFIQPMKTVGVIRRHDKERVIEIAEPFGVVAAVVPSTNPTSTAIYKILICLKARCPIVVSPHPSAVRSINQVAKIMTEAATGSGAPEGAINCMTTVTIEGTQELMRCREVAVVLATGGLGLVRSAYSSGKPAYGVGPGNAPAYIERSADLKKAVGDIITGKTFDNGLLCSSENSVVVDETIARDVRSEFEKQGGYFLDPKSSIRLAEKLVTPEHLPHPAFVGRTALEIAKQAGIDVPGNTRVLIAPLDGVGRKHPLSIEKLCPVLSFYVVADWRMACERCKEILGYGGMGHTMSIHSRDEKVIMEFGLRKPAFRIVVNTPSTLGSIGMTTGLAPSMTLGCGGYGGNITSDNLTPLHLLNIKRLAYEVRQADCSESPELQAGSVSSLKETTERTSRGVDPRLLSRRIESFLASRGIAPRKATNEPNTLAPKHHETVPTGPSTFATASPASVPEPTSSTKVASEVVCEEDVRQAIRENRPIAVNNRTIITPTARDLGQQHRVFVETDLLD